MMSTTEPAPLWVIKLGGSLWRNNSLPDWLSCLSDGAAAGKQLCVVPGGGLFAEAVREAQQHWSFPDEAAHDMALLAMHQYGLMLESMSAALVSLDGQGSITATTGNGAGLAACRRYGLEGYAG